MSHSPRIYESLEGLDLREGSPVVLTIGTFDGVHRAHQEIFREAVQRANALGGRAAVLTFRNHPRAIVDPEHTPPLLTDWDMKRNLIAEFGVDVIVGLDFKPDFARIRAEDFVRRIVAGQFAAKVVMSGPGFHFGHMAKGGPDLLRAMSGELGYTYHKREPVLYEGEKVSSTRIRKALAGGDVALAKALLDRPHKSRGRVVDGNKLGRTIGFPTANIRVDPRILVPGDGVYAVEADLPGGVSWPGMMNIGWRPTVGGDEHRLEVHLIDFQGDLMGEEISVRYIDRLRGEEKFDGLDQLKAQLAKDRQAAIGILG